MGLSTVHTSPQNPPDDGKYYVPDRRGGFRLLELEREGYPFNPTLPVYQSDEIWIVAPEHSVTVYEGGMLIELETDRMGYSPKRIVLPKARGEITDFSFASRKRLLRKVSRLNQNLLDAPIFVTLTYPGVYSEEFTEWKRHLDNFAKRCERKYPAGFFFWKLEFQKRGAPHYHLMVFRVKNVDMDWLSQAWYEIVGSGDERHLRAGTRVERSHGWQAILGYTAKYMGKPLENQKESIGRVWGLKGEKNFNKCVGAIKTDLEYPQFVKLRRALRNFISTIKPDSGAKDFYHRPYEGITLFLHQETAENLIDLVGSEGLETFHSADASSAHET